MHLNLQKMCHILKLLEISVVLQKSHNFECYVNKQSKQSIQNKTCRKYLERERLKSRQVYEDLLS